MDVFISWSGERSKIFGQKLAEWLPDVLQSIKPFFSADDIEKGSRWATVVAERLDKAGFGIICLTRDTMNSAWLNFEAGALSRRFHDQTDTPVATLLLDIPNASDVPQPLGQFNATLAEHSEILKLLKAINAASGEDRLEPERLSRIFETMWPKLEPAIAEARREMSVDLHAGDEDDPDTQTAKLNEILAILRQMERSGAVMSRLPQFIPAGPSAWQRGSSHQFATALRTWVAAKGIEEPNFSVSNEGAFLDFSETLSVEDEHYLHGIAAALGLSPILITYPARHKGTDPA